MINIDANYVLKKGVVNITSAKDFVYIASDCICSYVENFLKYARNYIDGIFLVYENSIVQFAFSIGSGDACVFYDFLRSNYDVLFDETINFCEYPNLIVASTESLETYLATISSYDYFKYNINDSYKINPVVSAISDSFLVKERCIDYIELSTKCNEPYPASVLFGKSDVHKGEVLNVSVENANKLYYSFLLNGRSMGDASFFGDNFNSSVWGMEVGQSGVYYDSEASYDTATYTVSHYASGTRTTDTAEYDSGRHFTGLPTLPNFEPSYGCETFNMLDYLLNNYNKVEFLRDYIKPSFVSAFNGYLFENKTPLELTNTDNVLFLPSYDGLIIDTYLRRYALSRTYIILYKPTLINYNRELKMRQNNGGNMVLTVSPIHFEERFYYTYDITSEIVLEFSVYPIKTVRGAYHIARNNMIDGVDKISIYNC